mgnify:CR=1 FL=1
MFWVAVACDLIIPIVMIIAGWFMYKKTPKNVNHVIGYRTPMSMKNQDTWDFANAYCGKLWIKVGTVLSVVSFASHLPFYNFGEDALSIVIIVVEFIQIIVLVGTIAPVESQLKKKFDILGNRI